MLDRPLISIMTVVHRDGELLADCLESLRSQTYEHWEHIVVLPGGSERMPDTARRIAAADPRIRVRTLPRDVPPAECWNSALRRSSRRSLFCMMLGARDRLTPDALETLLRAARRTPAAGVIGSLKAVADRIEGMPLPGERNSISGRLAARLFLGEKLTGSPLKGALVQAQLVRDRIRLHSPRYHHPDLPSFLDLLARTDFGMVAEVLCRSDPAPPKRARRERLTLLRDWLMCLQEFGPRYLERDELERQRRIFLRRYYRALVRHALAPKERQYLSYHLWQAGCAPSILDLARAATVELADLLRGGLPSRFGSGIARS